MTCKPSRLIRPGEEDKVRGAERVCDSPAPLSSTPSTEGFALSSDSTRPRPEWIKFNFRDLRNSLKWKRMTLAQRGAYITLLQEQALDDCLPTDPEDLACVAACTGSNITEADFLDAWAKPITDCFEERSGRLVNPRMANELDEFESGIDKKRNAKSRAGAKGASKRWQKDGRAMADDGRAMADDGRAMADDGLDRDRDRDRDREPEREKTRKRARGADALLDQLDEIAPESWLAEVLTEYKQHRKDIKAKSLTVRGWKSKATSLRSLGEASARACVDLSVSNGWTGLFPEKFSPRAPQAPSAGCWYKGPKLKDVEARVRRMEICARMQVEVNDPLLPQEDAMQMARERGDWKMHEYDWMTGRRQDPPPPTPPEAAEPVILEGLDAPF